ncbi:uncharacterized protein PV09_07879 [Verruconis gallopava]|uniref:alpha-L-rhamnosidase n=1 Tax=Verruconis gallopava TaxID=253628 RepID=A0A0D2A2H0_9PEZI|nr:uncharacterized protein PV09_07879 [Verruconis gallopava]KIW00520.1 hypothetical protein PV09_07879 [Verruconis gallopava]
MTEVYPSQEPMPDPIVSKKTQAITTKTQKNRETMVDHGAALRIWFPSHLQRPGRPQNQRRYIHREQIPVLLTYAENARIEVIAISKRVDNMSIHLLKTGLLPSRDTIRDKINLLRICTKFQNAKLEKCRDRWIPSIEYVCMNSQSLHSVDSDSTWKTTVSGPQLESSWYGGEEYNATLEIPGWPTLRTDISKWARANETLNPPPGQLVTTQFPPINVVDRWQAINVTSTKIDGNYVFDFSTNFAGWYALKIRERNGVRVTFWPSERLLSDGGIDQSTTGNPIYDAFTSDGSETIYSPRFMYHGFRYIGVNLTYQPSAGDLEALVIRTTVESVGTFESSDTMVNSIYKIVDHAIQSNIYSVMTDCPQREKLGCNGWLEQTHIVFDTVIRDYDIDAFGKGVMTTIMDSQATGGLVLDISPEFVVFVGGFRDDPNWGDASVLLPLNLYQGYGDLALVSDAYDIIKKYVSFLADKTTIETLSYGLGDWIAFDTSTPLSVTTTFGYQQALSGMITIAQGLGLTDDVATYTGMLNDTITSFNQYYWNSSCNWYGSGSRASNAIALDMGAVETNLQTRISVYIVELIQANGSQLSVGEIALPSLFRSLQNLDRNDTIYDMDSPVAEYGECNCLNHFILSYVNKYIAELSGLAHTSTSNSWDTLTLRPIFVANMTYTKSSCRSVKGMAIASWELADNKDLIYNVTVPVGANASVIIDFSTKVSESGTVMSSSKYKHVDGILGVSQSNGTTTIEISSGSFYFHAS